MCGSYLHLDSNKTAKSHLGDNQQTVIIVGVLDDIEEIFQLIFLGVIMAWWLYRKMESSFRLEMHANLLMGKIQCLGFALKYSGQNKWGRVGV